MFLMVRRLEPAEDGESAILAWLHDVHLLDLVCLATHGRPGADQHVDLVSEQHHLPGLSDLCLPDRAVSTPVTRFLQHAGKH